MYTCLVFQNTSSPNLLPVFPTHTLPPLHPNFFNYKQTLQSLDIDNLTLNPPTCSCSPSPFNYSSAGHIITGDVDIVENEDLKSLIRKGPKFTEPRSFNWRQNFVSIMNAVEDYAKRWATRENEELDTLSEWVKSIRGILKS
jgi:hypothetical protein